MFSNRLHGNIVSRSKFQKNVKKPTSLPTISDMMLDNTSPSSNKLPCTEISKSTRIPQFLDNPKLSKIWMYGKCLIASTKAKHTILNEYNAKFEGKFVRSTTTKKKGELVSRCDTQFSTQRQLEQSSVMKLHP